MNRVRGDRGEEDRQEGRATRVSEVVKRMGCCREDNEDDDRGRGRGENERNCSGVTKEKTKTEEEKALFGNRRQRPDDAAAA